jgi:hypothetical protein
MEIIRKSGESGARVKLDIASKGKELFVSDVLEAADRDKIIQKLTDQYIQIVMERLAK